MNVFTVPPDVSFLDALARSILSGGLPLSGATALSPHELAQWRLYLPTRRAQAAMEQAFLTASGMSAMLLPQVVALGEVDDLEDIDADNAGAEGRPIGALERRFLLAGMIAQWTGRYPDNALARVARTSTARLLSLAESLGSLIDDFALAEVDLARISELTELEIPGHLEDARTFLDIVRQQYPDRLAAMGCIGRYEHQAKALARLANRIETAMPHYPVVAAGSTGSIPATARLLKAIAASPNGVVVLPGLDRDMDDESWDALEPQDAQYGLRELLRQLGMNRRDVSDLPGLVRAAGGMARAFVLRETTRPAATTEAWSSLLASPDTRLLTGADGLKSFAAPDQRLEALAIALILRETLERPEATAALVTPDRSLAVRVATELRRWNIEVDDSAGAPLSLTPAGTLSSLVLRAMLPDAETHDLLALLRHPLFAPGVDRGWLDPVVASFEIAVLRGPRRPIDPPALRERIAEARAQAEHPHTHPLIRRFANEDWDAIARLGVLFERTLAPLHRALFAPPPRPLLDLVSAHREALAAVTAMTGSDATGSAGERVQSLLDSLAEHAADCPPMSGADYADFFDELLRVETIRDQRRAHPRLLILGLLEARLVRSDVTVLGGLNEGVWPPIASPEPWLSRLEKQKLGLQLPERRVGLNAHDFVQNAAGPSVWLTWSAKIGGKPALPSRFIERLRMLTGGKPAPGCLHRLEDARLQAIVGALEKPGQVQPVAAPLPEPPVAARPTRLSVSAVHDLIRDPYGFYAKRILKLRRLEPLAADPTAADRGNVIHAVAHGFVTARRQNPGADPLTLYQRVVEEEMAALPGGPAARAVLASRLSRIGPFLVEFDAEASAGAIDTLTEVDGGTAINPGAEGAVHLTARADRIDVLPGAVRIVDYKTGSLPSASETTAAFHPQLLIEALIAQAGGFLSIGPVTVESLRYVKLSGRDQAGEEKQIGNLQQALEKADSGLARLFTAYADAAQPYPAVIPPATAYPGDYDLLSRWKEWSANLPASDRDDADD
jgi:ATP-dependent helicase/nuclease subunit B